MRGECQWCHLEKGNNAGVSQKGMRGNKHPSHLLGGCAKHAWPPHLIVTAGSSEALEMTRDELERKIVETSVLVCVTSNADERECYLDALMHYEHQLESGHYECDRETLGTNTALGQLEPFLSTKR